jgi:UDP-glucose:(heptosyl)LPS alpha-1,3-glucosyltransferase
VKIALVRARYNPHGGAERFAARAMAALAADRDRDFEVAVLARRWDDVEAADVAMAPRLIRCDPFYVGSVWRDASFATAVRRRLADERFDLIQSHERIVGLPIYRAGDGVHAAWLERRAQSGGAATRLAIAMNPHHRYLLTVERQMFEHPALRAVICNSDMVRREIRARFAIDEARLVLIRNGVDLDRFEPGAADVHRRAQRARLAIADDATVFTMVGSGFERKGVGLALLGMRDCPDAVLTVVGDDKHRLRYESDAARLGVADRVRFVGGVSDPLPFYAMADFHLAPTLYDPFPNAVLEALACGLPVITTDACGGAELVVEEVGGWVVPSNEPEAVEVAMQIAVATGPARRAAMREAARRSAEPFSLAALSTALTGLYRSLLQPA